MPATSGTSGPTTVRSIFSACANFSRRGMSVALMSTFVASRPVPALPGAQKTCVTVGDCFSFQTIACSRPPLPITRTNEIRAGKHHCHIVVTGQMRLTTGYHTNRHNHSTGSCSATSDRTSVIFPLNIGAGLSIRAKSRYSQDIGRITTIRFLPQGSPSRSSFSLVFLTVRRLSGMRILWNLSSQDSILNLWRFLQMSLSKSYLPAAAIPFRECLRYQRYNNA
jgi:hypothetical protein